MAKRKPAIKTIGVRFIYSNGAGFGPKIYTYGVRRGAKVYLGQQLVVENQYGTQVVVVVRVDKVIEPHSAVISQQVATL